MICHRFKNNKNQTKMKDKFIKAKDGLLREVAQVTDQIIKDVDRYEEEGASVEHLPNMIYSGVLAKDIMSIIKKEAPEENGLIAGTSFAYVGDWIIEIEVGEYTAMTDREINTLFKIQ